MADNTGRIAQAAQSEMPLTWKALRDDASFGASFLSAKVRSVCTSLFGTDIPEGVESALDQRVVDYAGKLLALELVNPGVDYWGKQPLSIGATGRNENKGYKDRSQDLRILAERLLAQTRTMWPEVELLLPARRFRTVPNIARVRDVAIAHTPNPYDFEPPYET
jgi:hypothetical protein